MLSADALPPAVTLSQHGVGEATPDNHEHPVVLAPLSYRPPEIPLVPGIDIADDNQLAFWLFKVQMALNTSPSPMDVNALVHIEGKTTLAVAHCMVELIIYLHTLHTPANLKSEWKNPPGIMSCNVTDVTLQSFLHENHIFIV